ncbi:hypothetical protein HGP28_02695 [Vibrio sp. SM6]|uniref:Spondin domain-containing protein n=1 Tax=Vibrio agarilyticus TaxID=2726741 RepID=A0A7X8YFY9_9VIBR|nr:spondin domain-containing protein [Vibrio agarilyticus]NLS11797.1 hypothetical protein [Vibrio agarilyticus]
MNYRVIAALSVAGILTACHDGDDHDNTARYMVSIENVTSSQPLSPMTILTHNDQFQLFTVGQPASVPLEQLAEAGDNADLLALSRTDPNVYQTASGSGVIAPGTTQTVTLTVEYYANQTAAVAAMLVNTNDAFVGENALPLSSLAVGESFEMNMVVWDAGTEANDESADTIPGPAAANLGDAEGFNPERDDTDVVSTHPGVVSAADGLPSSVLGPQHRFVNPAAVVTITRLD